MSLPPNMRRIDPDAEAARLAEERKRAEPWYILLGEIHDLPEGGQILVQVSSDRPLAFKEGLGGALANTVRSYLPETP